MKPLSERNQHLCPGMARWQSLAAILILVASVPAAADELTAFRVRTAFEAPLNADEGWAADLNQAATVTVDSPFRLRVAVRRGASATNAERFSLEYQRNGGEWEELEAFDFPYPKEDSPRISIVSTKAYVGGAPTQALLGTRSLAFTNGEGLNFAAQSGPWQAPSGSRGEWEWPIVIRRFSDDALLNYEGDRFTFRLVNSAGEALPLAVTPEVRLHVPAGHLGGTYVESPGRIGPWEADNGDLYFIMEPSETDNRFMVVKSSDGGATWEEANGARRPPTGDLEAVPSFYANGTIHMLQQTSEAVWYHAFNTSDHPVFRDYWAVRSELLATPVEPPTQVAAIAGLPDGRLVAFYGGPEKIHYQFRSPSGTWGEVHTIGADLPQILSGPQALTDQHGQVHLAYLADDGTAWYRRIHPDGTLTPRQLLSDGLGTEVDDFGSILPLVYMPESDTLAVIYRLASGALIERRVNASGTLSAPVTITTRPVAQNPVDSSQTAADAVQFNGSVHVLFIAEDNRHIYHTFSTTPGTWSTPKAVIQGTANAWVRGNILKANGRTPAYGFIYDAGSEGGSGFNRFAEIPLNK